MTATDSSFLHEHHYVHKTFMSIYFLFGTITRHIDLSTQSVLLAICLKPFYGNCDFKVGPYLSSPSKLFCRLLPYLLPSFSFEFVFFNVNV